MLQRSAPTIRDLLSYRLHQVASLLSRGAEMRYRREFGVSPSDVRLAAQSGISPTALAKPDDSPGGTFADCLRAF